MVVHSTPQDPHEHSGDGEPEGGGPARPVWYGSALLAIAVIAAGCSIFLYNWLSQWRWSVSVAATATAPANGVIPHTLLTGDAGHPVRWSIGAAYIRQLTVTGAAQGTALVILPLPRAGCAAIAAQLHAPSCTSAGQLTLPSPATFAWSGLVLADTNGAMDSAASVEVAQDEVGRGQPDLEVVPTPPGNPTLCFASPQGAAVQLTVTSGSRPYRHVFTGREPAVPCDQAVSIRVGLGSSAPPVLDLSGVAGLSFGATGRSATLQGFAGQLSLDPGATTVASGPEDVLVCDRSASCPVTVTLSVGQSSPVGPTCPLAPASGTGQTGQVLTVCSAAARSVVTRDGQLVPSAWARQTDIFAPLLGGFVTACVIGPLTVFVQLLTDALKNWPGPKRRRPGRAIEVLESEPKEADHAA